jgi:hypothetical protein
VYNWGTWAEVSAEYFEIAMNRWDDPEQSSEPRFAGELANEFPGMPSTLGLRGWVQLVSAHRVPDFYLDPSVDHPLVREQQNGVFAERLVEWSMLAIHGKP